MNASVLGEEIFCCEEGGGWEGERGGGVVDMRRTEGFEGYGDLWSVLETESFGGVVCGGFWEGVRRPVVCLGVFDVVWTEPEWAAI